MSSWQYFSIGSDNGLAPNRRKAIIWTYDVLGCRCLNASLSFNELNLFVMQLGMFHKCLGITLTRQGPWTGRVENLIVWMDRNVLFLGQLWSKATNTEDHFEDGGWDSRRNGIPSSREVCSPWFGRQKLYGERRLHRKNRRWVCWHFCPFCLCLECQLQNQKQLSRAWISNYIPQNTVGCNYLFMP